MLHLFEQKVAARVAVGSTSSPAAVDLLAIATFLEEDELCRRIGATTDELAAWRAGDLAIDPGSRTRLAMLVLERSGVGENEDDRARLGRERGPPGGPSVEHDLAGGRRSCRLSRTMLKSIVGDVRCQVVCWSWMTTP